MYCLCGRLALGVSATRAAGAIAHLTDTMRGRKAPPKKRGVHKAHLKYIGVGWGTILRYRKQCSSFF